MKESNKNIINKVFQAVLLLLVGEGIFGWALYWPVLWSLLDWKYIYWLAFVLGLLMVGFWGWGIGLMSLLMVLGVWLMKATRGILGKNTWLEVWLIVIIAWLADVFIAVDFSLAEAMLIFLLALIYKSREEKESEIRI